MGEANLFGQEIWARRGEAQTAAATAVSGALPVGVITAYWGTTAPAGWLLCDGAAIPATYPTLIALVGANTPNLKGMVIVGIDAAQTEFDTLGETGGSKTSTAPHTHDLASHTHTGTSGAENTTHTHQLAWRPAENTNAADVQGWPANNGHTSLRTSDHAEWGGFTLRTTDGPNVGHSHTTTTGGPNGGGNTSGASSASTSSGNLQPYAALSYIIRAL